MPNESVSAGNQTKRRRQATPRLERAVEWPIMVVFGAGLTGLWIANELAAWSSSSSTPDIAIWTGSLVAASLATLLFAMSSLLSSSQSRLRHVFCGRRILIFAGALSIIGVALAGSIIRRNVLGQFLSHGGIGATEIVDAGLILAAVACLTGAGIAFFGAADAYREERSWHLSFGGGLR